MITGGDNSYHLIYHTNMQPEASPNITIIDCQSLLKKLLNSSKQIIELVTIVATFIDLRKTPAISCFLLVMKFTIIAISVTKLMDLALGVVQIYHKLLSRTLSVSFDYRVALLTPRTLEAC